MDKIILSEIKVMATHGVNPEEKLVKQPFNITITCYLDLAPAAADDDIEATVNYAELYQRVVHEVESTSFNLIEALAGHLADQVLLDQRIRQVTVRVEKTQARTGTIAFPAAVELERYQQPKGGRS